MPLHMLLLLFVAFPESLNSCWAPWLAVGWAGGSECCLVATQHALEANMFPGCSLSRSLLKTQQKYSIRKTLRINVVFGFVCFSPSKTKKSGYILSSVSFS